MTVFYLGFGLGNYFFLWFLLAVFNRQVPKEGFNDSVDSGGFSEPTHKRIYEPKPPTASAQRPIPDDSTAGIRSLQYETFSKKLRVLKSAESIERIGTQ